MKLFLQVVLILSTIPLSNQAQANIWDNKTILQMQVDTRPCIFFNLNGVSEADPAVPGEAWFAVPRSFENFQEMYTMLLSAKLSGKNVGVRTDGSITCGYATAVVVALT